MHADVWRILSTQDELRKCLSKHWLNGKGVHFSPINKKGKTGVFELESGSSDGSL